MDSTTSTFVCKLCRRFLPLSYGFDRKHCYECQSKEFKEFMARSYNDDKKILQQDKKK